MLNPQAHTVTLEDGRDRLTQRLRIPIWDDVDFFVDVPEGFESDGATIPSLLWFVIGPPMRGRHRVPAFAHDWLCTQADTYAKRVMADGVFFALLHKYRVPAWKRCAMYLGVRFYGRFFWKRKAGV